MLPGTTGVPHSMPCGMHASKLVVDRQRLDAHLHLGASMQLMYY